MTGIDWTYYPRALLRALLRFSNNHGFVLSSHVAMSMMLALFPFILFVVALAGAVSRDLDIGELIDLIFGLWPEDIAAPIVQEINAVLNEDSVGLMTIGGVLALYFASNGVDAVRVAVSTAYREHDPRPFWKTRALCVLFVLAGGGLLILGLTIGIGLPAYLRYAARAVPDQVQGWADSAPVGILFTVAALTFAVSACHIWLPGLRHSFRQIWPGVALTIALWFAAVWAFSIYVASFASYAATYAGLAGAMAALIFLYLIAAIMILGAEFNGVLIRWKKARKG